MDRLKQEQFPPLRGFDLFWSRYPTKFNRGHAQAIWDDIDPTPAQQEAFLGALTIEAGDRERARRAGRQLPTQTGALWLIEHRHLGGAETVLTTAAHALRHAWQPGFLPERDSSIRRLAARAAQAAFMVAFPVTLAAMAVHGWTAP